MRPWYRIIIIIFIGTLFAISVLAQDDNTDSSPQENTVIVRSAFVRSGPNNDYEAVGALFEGDEVFPLNISADTLWILIPYSRGNGWIQRNLVRWEDEIALNQLPVFPANITPTPRMAITSTPFIPSATPEGNYVNVVGAASAYVRAGPGRGYLRLGQLLPGDAIEAFARNEDTSWIMVAYSDEFLEDGFGWLATELVYWEDYASLNDLPVIQSDNLTPTLTFTPGLTSSITPTSTATNTETAVPTETSTLIPTETAIPTETSSPIPTETATPTETASPVPTETATLIPTETAIPTETSSPVPTETATPTETAIPTETSSPVPTETATPTETAIPTETSSPVPTETAIPTETETAIPTETETAIPTETASPVPTETATEAVTDIFAIQETSVALNATDSAASPPDATILEESPVEENPNSIPLEAIVGITLLLLVLIYIWFYWQGLSATGRYADGFVIEVCPVCQQGHLQIDERQSRNFGIPTVRRTVRCDVCRSVLRETGTQRWRYAVDRIENLTMYNRFNGREITDTDLERLAKTPPDGASARTSPKFLEGDAEE